MTCKCKNPDPYRVVEMRKAQYLLDGKWVNIGEETLVSKHEQTCTSCASVLTDGDVYDIEKKQNSRKANRNHKRYSCNNCEWVGNELEIEFPDIPDLASRLSPGEEVPAGECPLCRSLAHVTESVPAEARTLYLWQVELKYGYRSPDDKVCITRAVVGGEDVDHVKAIMFNTARDLNVLFEEVVSVFHVIGVYTGHLIPKSPDYGIVLSVQTNANSVEG